MAQADAEATAALLSQGEIEARFCKPVEPRLAHRLPPLQQAALAQALECTRASHHAVHRAYRILAEGIEHQQDLRRAARAELQQVLAAAAAAELAKTRGLGL